MKLYRLEILHDAEYLDMVPRVPDNLMESEDATTERICTCPTVLGCIRALDLPDGLPFGFEVYKALRSNKELLLTLYSADVRCNDIYVPSESQLPDGFATGEVWITSPYKFNKESNIFIGLQEDISEYVSKYYVRYDKHPSPFNNIAYGREYQSSKSFNFLVDLGVSKSAYDKFFASDDYKNIARLNEDKDAIYRFVERVE